MYHQLATRFGRNSHQITGREALDNEALYRHVPSVFAREAHERTSSADAVQSNDTPAATPVRDLSAIAPQSGGLFVARAETGGPR